MKKNRFSFLPLHIFDLILIFIAFLYYLFFVNKGLVAMDEGYMLHMAERIANGQVIFKDFYSQYAPGYQFLIAGFFLIFGKSIIVSRILSLLFSLGIIALTFLILNKLKIKSYLIHLLSFLSLIAFGYPLLNIAIISWPIVFFSLFLIYLFICFFEKKNIIYLIFIGLDIALILFFKQNFGLYFLLTSIILLLSLKDKVENKINFSSILFASFFIPSFIWIYFLLIKSPDGFFSFLNFSLNFATHFKFSYPPLSFIFEPLGVFKLIPYYLPIVFGLVIMYKTIQKKLSKKEIVFYFIPLIGFFGLIYPGSDLLHLYPFYGFILVCFLVYFIRKNKYFAIFVILINLLIGFYLTNFREYFRYNPPYKYQNTNINVPRANNILTTEKRAVSIKKAFDFIQENTEENEAIFVYPTSPIFYFLFDRPNPLKDSLYITPYTMTEDRELISLLRNKKIRYVVTDGGYENLSQTSLLIQKQKKVKSFDQINIFEISSF